MPQFGQPPLAALLPLKAGQNLADLPDKAASLANLGTLSSSDIMMNAVPIGTIISFWGATAPVGYLPCNGQTVNSGTFPDLVTFLGGGSSQALPDLRGEFLRGWDNGRGVDVARAIKTLQLDQLQGFAVPAATANGSNGPCADTLANGTLLSTKILPITDGVNGTPRVGSETRPRNVAVQYCMKAYGALVNTATANIGNVLTELSQTVKTTQFENSLNGLGYQKLPGGLIIQWGPGATTTTDFTLTLPVAFPNGVFYASATDSGVLAGGQAVYPINSYGNFPLLGATTTLRFTSATTPGAFVWMAIGY